MIRPTLLALGSVALLACGADEKPDGSAAAPDPSSDARDDAPAMPAASTAWEPAFEPPTERVTPRFRMEPLAPRHNELDFAAAQGSREHLQRTLQWGDWPSADATPEDNRGDLERHWGEFQRREAYAYTVLAPDGSRCLGCVYINPVGQNGSPAEPERARVAFWVIEPELANDLDRALAQEVIAMIEAEFPLDRVDFPVPVENERGARILGKVGLEETGARTPTHRTFVWRRGS